MQVLMTEGKKNRIYSVISWVLIALFLVVSIIAVVKSPKMLHGDGYEYILLSQSFENHGTFDIREGDIEETVRTFPEYSGLVHRAVNEFLIYDKSNDLRTYHFGGYSALASPFIYVCEKAGADPLYGFCVLNIILWTTCLLAVKLLLKTSDIRKLILLALLIINPVWFYLVWIHSEVYIFALIVIALVCRYNKWYAPSILITSIAALQNIGVMPIAMVVGIEYIKSVLDQAKTSDVDKKWRAEQLSFLAKRILPYGVFFLPAFVPYLLNYIHFKRFSPMADSVMTTEDLFRKALAYLFDLNMGLGVYAPVLMITFFVLAFISLFKKKNLFVTTLDLLALTIILLIIAHEKQINCDMFAIMRYNVWILPIMIFYLVLLIERIDIRSLIIFASSLIYTGAMIIYVLYGSGTYSYVQFAPWTRVVLEKAPWAYNPPTGIFYSRTTGGERYEASTAVGYSDKDGNLHKVLLSSEAADSDSWFISSPDGNIIDHDNYDEELKVTRYSSEYEYINITSDGYHLYQMNDSIDYVAGHMDINPGAGLHIGNGGCAWATDHVFVALPGRIGEAISYEMVFVPYCCADELFEMDIYINNMLADHVVCDESGKAQTLLLSVDSSEEINYIEIKTNTSFNDHSVSSSIDRSWQLRYIGEAIVYKPGDRIMINSKSELIKHDILNEMYYESDGAWTIGHNMHFSIITSGSSEIRLRVNNILGGGQAYDLYVNGEFIGAGTAYGGSEITIPVRDGYNDIYLDMPTATSPAAIGMSDDGRTLALRLSYIDVM